MEVTEFFTTPNGEVHYQSDGLPEKRLTKFSTDIIETMITIIQKNYPECFKRLYSLYKGHSEKIVDRFVRCNMGSYDLLSKDFDHGFIHFEEVQCPLRGICQDEHVICKPKSYIHLSHAERDVIHLYINGKTLDEIASELKKGRSTVKTQLIRVKNKLGVKNCRDIITVMRSIGWTD